MFKVFDCAPKERLRRAIVLVMIAAVIYVPGTVAFVMLLTGAD